MTPATVWHQFGSLRSRYGLDRGSAVVEYVLLLALIALVCLFAITYLGESTSGRFSSIASQVASS